MWRQLFGALGESRAVRKALTSFPPTAAMVRRFVPAEGVEGCVAAVRALRSQGLSVTVDYLGEDVTSHEAARATVAAYVDLIGRLEEARLTDGAEVSVKLSALGQALTDGDTIALTYAREVCAAAAAAGTTVTLDAEDSTTIDRTHATLAALREEFPRTGIVLQAYLFRCPDDCERLATPGSRVRLCKGAYDEPATVAHRDKAGVDASYRRCLDILMEGEGYPMVATHDPAMISAARAAAIRTGRARGSYEFQLLYGVRPDEQLRLVEEGETVRVYVPYGSDWYGYYLRRLAERPANLLFFARALLPSGRRRGKNGSS